jgi:hypothetical protein
MLSPGLKAGAIHECNIVELKESLIWQELGVKEKIPTQEWYSSEVNYASAYS